MIQSIVRRRRLLGSIAALALAAATGTVVTFSDKASGEQAAAKPAPALSVSVSLVEQRNVALWDEFSGRLEAIERVEVRSRVAGAVKAVHFREGALVKQNDLLITIDPDPYAAEVARAEAQVAAAQARVALTKNEMDRGRQLSGTQIISQRDLDQRLNAHREAEANVRAAEATLQSAKLNLEYTQVRAPVDRKIVV